MVETYGLIEFKEKYFQFGGVGYDSNRPEKGYQILGYFFRVDDTCKKGYNKFAVYECASKTFKFTDSPFRKWSLWSALAEGAAPLSLKGNLFWIGYVKVPSKALVFLEVYSSKSFACCLVRKFFMSINLS